MGRELRFRAWDEAIKKWVGNFWHSMDRDEELHITFTDTEKLIIEQYTGLKDKNGKEIYEGDILWLKHFYSITGEDTGTAVEVYWEKEDASFTIGDWFAPLGDLVSGNEVEIIGNIHENPELLEKGEW